MAVRALPGCRPRPADDLDRLSELLAVVRQENESLRRALQAVRLEAEGLRIARDCALRLVAEYGGSRCWRN